MELETYAEIKRSVKTLLNLNLDYYKDEQMKRRLDSWLVRSGASNWVEYFQRVRADINERSRFRDYLTINVSTFFRDPDRWQSLRDLIIPTLLKEALSLRPKDTGLKIWSAGCSIGVEAYSLAILLEELSPTRRHKIMATDFDQSALKKAKAGGPYSFEEIQNLNPAQKTAYLQPDGPPFYIKLALAKRIEFKEHNLLDDPYPGEMDLIICRNVVIYFTSKTKDALYRKFFAALRQGGILFLGATEIIPRPHEFGLRSIGISLYKKT